MSVSRIELLWRNLSGNSGQFQFQIEIRPFEIEIGSFEIEIKQLLAWASLGPILECPLPSASSL